ncbi:MAG: GAP family protein [Chloroflexi bacterium]|nr:GAP family protein [Chloroflexota bacterium]
MAVGIAISPVPLIAVILMLFSPRPKSNSLAFLLGWALALFVIGGLALLLASTQDLSADTGEPSVLGSIINLALGLLLLWLAVRQWRSRPQAGKESKTPAWVAAINTFTPIKAVGLGALLSGLNPKNLTLNLSAMALISEADITGGQALVALLAFVLLSSLLVAVPIVFYLVGGESVKQTLEKWRAWLAAYGNTIITVILVLLGVRMIVSGIGGLF